MRRGRLVLASHADKKCTVKMNDESEPRCVDRDRTIYVLEGENWVQLR